MGWRDWIKKEPKVEEAEKPEEAGAISLRPDQAKSYTGDAPVIIVPEDTSPSQAIEMARSRGGGGGRSRKTGDTISYGQTQAQVKAEAKRKAELKKIADEKVKAEAKRVAELKATQTQRALREKALVDKMREQGKQRTEKIKEAQRKAREEQKRIEQYRKDLEKRGGQTTSKVFESQKKRHDVTIKRTTGERVFTVTDLETGKKTTSIYEKPKGGGRVQITSQLKTTPSEEIKKDESILTGSQNIFIKDDKTRIKDSTQFLIDRGVPKIVAKTGGAIAGFGMGVYNIIKQVDADVSERIPSWKKMRDDEEGLSGIDIKPIGYSKWSDERKERYNKLIKEQTKSQKQTSETYIPTTTRSGTERLWTKVKEKPLLTGGTLGGAVALSPITAVAGVTSITTGADIFIGDLGKKISKRAEETKKEEPIRGKIAEVTGGAVQGVSWLLPKTPTEILTYSAFTKYLPKIYKKYPFSTGTGLAVFSGYNIYSGTKATDTGEKYGKYLLGGLSIFGAVPGVIKGGRRISAWGSKDYIKSGKTNLAIQETKIDLPSRARERARDLSKAELETIEATKRTYGDIDVQFIPKRTAKYTKDIDQFKLLRSNVAYLDKPKLPETTKLQAKILDVVKKEKGIVSGSFAQQTLIRGSRKFADLDILSRRPKKIAQQIRKKLGDEVEVKIETITDSPLGKFDIYKVYDKKTGKHLADIDPLKYSEEGFGRMMGSFEVGGLKLLPPEVRYTSKVIQSTRPLPTKKRMKVIKDISQLSGKPELLTSPSLLRGYGLTKSEQKISYLKGDVLATHGGLGIIPMFGKKIKVVGKEGDIFYSTPSEVKGGVGYARKSRMGFDSETGGASMFELLRPSKWKEIEFIPKRKDIIIETGRMGKDFIQPNLQTSEIEIGREVGKKGFFEFDIVKKYKTIVSGEAVNIAFVKKAIKEKPSGLGGLKTGVIDISRRQTIKKDVLIPPVKTDVKTIKRETEVVERVKPLGKTDIIYSRIEARKTSEILLRTDTARDRIKSPTIRTTPTERDKILPTIRTTPTERKRATPPIREDLIRAKRERRDERKVKIITPPIIPKPSLAKRILARIKEEPKIFEAVGIRFGKEVKLGRGTKKQTSRKLQKFLSGTLGASGFLKTRKGKVKAIETGLLKKPSFRKSKVSEFLIVEKKEKRLKRGTQEVSELQFFKKKKSGKTRKTKKNSNKNLFDI